MGAIILITLFLGLMALGVGFSIANTLDEADGPERKPKSLREAAYKALDDPVLHAKELINAAPAPPPEALAEAYQEVDRMITSWGISPRTFELLTDADLPKLPTEEEIERERIDAAGCTCDDAKDPSEFPCEWCKIHFNKSKAELEGEIIASFTVPPAIIQTRALSAGDVKGIKDAWEGQYYVPQSFTATMNEYLDRFPPANVRQVTSDGVTVNYGSDGPMVLRGPCGDIQAVSSMPKRKPQIEEGVKCKRERRIHSTFSDLSCVCRKCDELRDWHTKLYNMGRADHGVSEAIIDELENARA